MSVRAWPFSAWQGDSVTFMAHILGPTGEIAEASDFESIEWSMRRQRNLELIIDRESIDIEDAIKDPFEVDIRWLRVAQQGPRSRNFAYTVPAEVLAVADHYRVEFYMTFATGEKSTMVFEGPVRIAGL